MLTTILPVVPPTHFSTLSAKADSGATSHYFTPNDAHILQNLTNTAGPIVALPNNETLASTQQGFLPFTTTLSNTAKKAHVFQGLKNHP